MKDHESYRELAAIYPLGTLDDQERQSLESHLAAGCEECESAVKEGRKIADELAQVIEPVAPSAEVRERLLERVRLDARHFASGRHRRGVWLLVAAAACLAALGLGIRVVSLQHELGRERNARLNLERDLAAAEESLEALTALTTRAVSLVGQGPAPGARQLAALPPSRRRNTEASGCRAPAARSALP